MGRADGRASAFPRVGIVMVQKTKGAGESPQCGNGSQKMSARRRYSASRRDNQQRGVPSLMKVIAKGKQPPSIYAAGIETTKVGRGEHERALIASDGTRAQVYPPVGRVPPSDKMARTRAVKTNLGGNTFTVARCKRYPR
ncbi:hypothetical protein MTO96_011846 [Rhipicephalus appendiculatus]